MWNNDWRTKLENEHEEVYIRLCECRNSLADMVIMSRLVHEYNPSKTKEDCFELIIEWVCDWNSQDYLYDRLTTSKYQEMLSQI